MNKRLKFLSVLLFSFSFIGSPVVKPGIGDFALNGISKLGSGISSLGDKTSFAAGIALGNYEKMCADYPKINKTILKETLLGLFKNNDLSNKVGFLQAFKSNSEAICFDYQSAKYREAILAGLDKTMHALLVASDKTWEVLSTTQAKWYLAGLITALAVHRLAHRR